eukprot:6400072-Alexandrium_andersonii.AAC.1
MPTMPSLALPLPNCNCHGRGAAAPEKTASCHCLPPPKEFLQAKHADRLRAPPRPSPPARE